MLFDSPSLKASRPIGQALDLALADSQSQLVNIPRQRTPQERFETLALTFWTLNLRRLEVRPVSILRISKLRFVDSAFPGSPLDMRIPPLNIKIMFDSRSLKSNILVQRLAVHTPETHNAPQTNTYLSYANDNRAGAGDDQLGHPRSVLIIPIYTISNCGSQISEPLFVFTSKCPLKVQISRGLGPFSQIELFKTGCTKRRAGDGIVAARCGGP